MQQLELPKRPTWGGARRNAGPRPAPGRRRPSHHRRPLHDTRCPAHATLRASSSLPSLRLAGIFPAIQLALRSSSTTTFRVLHFSVQRDHIHLLVEADAPAALPRGMQGLAIRVAKAINRTLRRRGKVWESRYHCRSLRTPREVRNALVYVLQNFRKHGESASGFDPCSSARWFTGWQIPTRSRADGAPTVPPRSWLAAVGWRRLGLLGLEEAPRPHRNPRSPAVPARRR